MCYQVISQGYLHGWYSGRVTLRPPIMHTGDLWYQVISQGYLHLHGLQGWYKGRGLFVIMVCFFTYIFFYSILYKYSS